jgi:hypothetical protein
MKILFFVFTLITSTIVSSNELKFYILPSPYGMDWTSPRNLLISAIKNKLSFEKRFIGHVAIETNCTLPHGEKWETMQGMKSPKFDVINQLIFHGIGLGILFHGFEGALETDDLHQEMKRLTQEKGSIINYAITSEQCLRLKTYLDEFKKHQIYKTYGLVHRPLMAEGAGCSAFAVSFLKVLGIYDQNLELEWGIKLQIPLNLAGAPVTNHYRSLWSLYQSTKWETGSIAKEIFFYEPDKMYQWTLKMFKEFPQMVTNNNQINLDLTLVPVPRGPIFTQPE